MKKLIVNADDFGLSKAVTDAIIDCHKNGIITSTTLMANMPCAEYAASIVKSFPKLSVGLHLNLTEGKPLSNLSEVDNLINSDGCFICFSPQRKNLRTNEKAEEQVLRELEAQLLKALKLGFNISHFDSHHFIHRAPVVQEALIKLHKNYGIPAVRAQKGLYWTDSKAKIYVKLIKMFRNLKKFKKIYSRKLQFQVFKRNGLLCPDRMIAPDYFIPHLSDAKQHFIQCLQAIPEGIFELALHPGYYDKESADSEEFKKIREFDTKIACDEDIKDCIKKCGINLISFYDLKGLNSLTKSK